MTNRPEPESLSLRDEGEKEGALQGAPSFAPRRGIP
jgi:hypothetical protein